ncbi:hypothetical protein QR680_009087 [Steinernema hermaphroditum]|uniref:Uncharacterized protein n=1 Tax=Steinernema hermaphroditum TaxID=289476 RepID=A0AA39IJ18_9BILA|nr:hypothetical protein QR680_009087 [Steinernema hermaphroditum]
MVRCHAAPESRSLHSTTAMGPKLRGYGHVLRDFSQWTSTHGVPHIGLASVLWLRLFWGAIVVFCLGMFLFQMHSLLVKYFDYKVNVDTKLEFGERTFPSVTLCHLNPWKRPKGNSTRLELLISEYEEGHPQLYGLDGAEKTAKASKWSALLSEEIFRVHRTESERNDTRGAPAASSDLVYRYEDLVLNCAYNTDACNASFFAEFHDPNYGVCYTFNADGKQKSSRAGPFYGLRMVFKADQDLYLPWSEASGIVVTLHDKAEVPFPNTNGYFAAPGEAASIGIRYSDSSRLPKPYGPCTQEEGGQGRIFYPTYNVETCLRSCIQEKIIRDCGCYDPSYWKPEDTAVSCANTKDPKQSMACIWEILNGDGADGKVADPTKDCKCSEPCLEMTYGVTMSTALWPANNYKPPECLRKIENDPADRRRPKYTTPEGCHQWYRQNTLIVEVYYERMNYQMLTESAAYGIIPLVSDTGGNIGLWLGMSIISMIEWGVLFVLTGCYCCCMAPPKTEEDEERERFREQQKKEKEEAKKAQKEAKKAPKAEEPRVEKLLSESLYAKENEAPLPPPINEAT